MKKANLSHSVEIIPKDKSIQGLSSCSLNSDQKVALDYLGKVRTLTPDIKEIKRAPLPASVKFSEEISKFEDSKEAVEG